MPEWTRPVHYARLIRLHRPIGTVLLAWPMLWALWIAGHGAPDPGLLAVFLTGAFLMRSAGCAINDYFDRSLDCHVARTRDRPLASGAISSAEALAIAGILLVLAATLAILCLNRAALLLTPAALLLALSYPLMKRITRVPQLFLGIAFSWPVLMVFAAIREQLPLTAWLLFAAGVCWTVAYDTEYAMADRADDRRLGIGSMALLLGHRDRLAVAILHSICLALLAAVGTTLGPLFHLGLVGAAGSAIWQQYLLRDRAAASCIRAFTNNGWFGLWVFLGVLAG